jgi:hypothetical protein
VQHGITSRGGGGGLTCLLTCLGNRVLRRCTVLSGLEKEKRRCEIQKLDTRYSVLLLRKCANLFYRFFEHLDIGVVALDRAYLYNPEKPWPVHPVNKTNHDLKRTNPGWTKLIVGWEGINRIYRARSTRNITQSRSETHIIHQTWSSKIQNRR